jgi:hypothetical protein
LLGSKAVPDWAVCRVVVVGLNLPGSEVVELEGPAAGVVVVDAADPAVLPVDEAVVEAEAEAGAGDVIGVELVVEGAAAVMVLGEAVELTVNAGLIVGTAGTVVP